MNTLSSKEILSEILVFKTNVLTDKDFETISRLLALEKRIIRWSIDREDIDKVLRIESDQLDSFAVIQLLRDADFLCEELPD